MARSVKQAGGRGRRARAGALLGAAALSVAATVSMAGGASAAGQPDLSIKQVISGSTQHGHLFDTFVVKNHGSGTASHINVELFESMAKPTAFSDLFTSGAIVCEVMPAPKGYDYATACQLTNSLAPGATATFKADFSGTAGVKFTTLATVGEFQGDAHVKDNTNSRTTYFGPGADLLLTASAKTGTTHGHATEVVKVGDHGPNDASQVQEVLEMKNVSGAHATGSIGSCQIIPPATGYTLAASCVRDSLPTGHLWTVSFDLSGTSGHRATVVASVTSQTKDPNPANNKATHHVTLK